MIFTCHLRVIVTKLFPVFLAYYSSAYRDMSPMFAPYSIFNHDGLNINLKIIGIP